MTTDNKFFVYYEIDLNAMQIFSPHLRQFCIYMILWRKYSFLVCIIYFFYEMLACIKNVYHILNERSYSPLHLNHKPITIPPTDRLFPVSCQCFRWCYFKAPQTFALKAKVNINLLTKYLSTYRHYTGYFESTAPYKNVYAFTVPSIQTQRKERKNVLK